MQNRISILFVFTLFLGSVFAQEMKQPVPKRPNLRIVDYGSDMGDGIYRNSIARLFNDVQVDVDGDGKQQDGSVSGWEFSMTEPLSPSSPAYNTQAPSHRYYGGIIGYHANQPSARLTEGFLNANHELRDDMNLMSNQTASSKKAGNTVQAWGVWFWKKEDFLNTGADRQVRFDDNSLLVLHISRYWDDIDGGRWVVRDGDTFYISEATFGTAEDIEKRGGKTRLSWWQSPTQTRWAVYTPQEPYDVRFDAGKAEFKEQSFNNITATGFYLYKDSKTIGVISVKWHSFETYAVVDLPQTPSLHLNMEMLDSERAVSKTKVDYETWRRVYNWAVSNQYATGLDQRGYVFDRDGDMGLMDVSGQAHSARDAATDMSWLDAVLWCNALSELEGLTPAYYEDAEHTSVLRKIRERKFPEQYAWKPDVHVRWEADGYRLPTGIEWTVASGNNAVTGCQSGPHEWVWGTAERMDVVKADSPGFNAMGGDTDSRVSEWVYPGGASPYVGFRPVRALGDGWLKVLIEALEIAPYKTLPASGQIGERVLKDTVLPDEAMAEIKGGNYIRNDEAHVTVSDYFFMKTEVPFSLWNTVYQSALPLGYVFDRDGDMGSMDWNPGEKSHSPNEPVTDVGWYDSIIWCNALSELSGRTPVYYSDEAKTQVMKTAVPWRIRMVPEGHGADHTREVPVYTKWEADGYRLPTWAEWFIALRAEDGNYRAREGKEWTAEHSDERTHPVGTSDPNPWGIYDLQGNVSEWLHDTPVNDYYRPENPKGDQRDSLFGLSIAGGRFNTPSSHDSGQAREKNRKSAAWPWLGFRVVRCEANAHSDKPFVPKVILDVQPENFDPLQGRVFRGNMRRNGLYETSGLPVLKGERWKIKTGGPVLSSPVVVDGVVFVGSDDGFFYALDAVDGKEKWKLDTGGPVQGSAVIGRDGVVYIGSESGWLYALDAATGAEKWKFAYDERQPSRMPATTSPGLAHGVVFCGFGRWGGAYVGVDASSGLPVWKLRGRSPNSGLLGPTVDGVQFYAPVNDNVLMSASIRTEMPIEDFDNNGHHCMASVAIQGDLLFYSQGPSLKIARKDNGRKQAELYIQGAGLSFFPQSGPAATEDRVYVSKGNNRLYCLNISNLPALNEVWTNELPAQVRSSLGIAGDVLYYGCDDGKVYALDRNTGEEKWQFATGGPVASSPWPGDGVLFVGSEDGFVYALE